MMRIDNPDLSSSDVGEFLKNLGWTRANNLLSNVIVEMWTCLFPKEYKSKLEDHQIPKRYEILHGFAQVLENKRLSDMK